MSIHPYGEKVLDQNPPPERATGLIVQEWFTREEQYGTSSWFSNMVFGKKEQVYFIFRNINGSYDYMLNGEETCGTYTAMLGYWHYKTEQERDEKYASLIKG